ncbi:MAG: VWA domain-containing protein, partial [Notoacmeibacter sp.]|nr:VWA domain-containing protein [Notoacmeibacter sp.]
MFIPFFLELKAAKVPVSLREYLSLLEGMEAGLVDYDVEGFYYLARAALVKDERFIDRFDQVFAHAFKGVEAVSGEASVDVMDLPEEWLRRLAEKHLTDEEKKLV